MTGNAWLPITAASYVTLGQGETVVLLEAVKVSRTVTVFLPARRYASEGTSHGSCVCLSVCLSQVGVLSKRMDEWSWVFFHWSFLPLIVRCVKWKFE